MASQKEQGAHTAPSTKKSRVGAGKAGRQACRDLAELITHRPEAVSAVCRSEEGWRVHVDVLELPRIPDTTSLLATYEVELDEQGELKQYRRIRRFRRGAADD